MQAACSALLEQSLLHSPPAQPGCRTSGTACHMLRASSSCLRGAQGRKAWPQPPLLNPQLTGSQEPCRPMLRVLLPLCSVEPSAPPHSGPSANTSAWGPPGPLCPPEHLAVVGPPASSGGRGPDRLGQVLRGNWESVTAE